MSQAATHSAHRAASARWSQRVTETSDALTLEQGVFKKGSPKAIAASLKRSAEASHRRKSERCMAETDFHRTFSVELGRPGLSNLRAIALGSES